MTTPAQRRELAIQVVASQIEEAREEIREHQRHVIECEHTLAVLLTIQEALQASQSPETDQ